MIREEDLDQLAVRIIPKLQDDNDFSIVILQTYLKAVWDYGVAHGIQEAIEKLRSSK